MKVALVGKGGSGKTTLTALIGRYLAEQRLPVLAIDADINQHLLHTLGMPPESAARIPPLGIEVDRIKKYLRGTNPRIKATALMIKTTPPGQGSRLIRFNEPNPIFEYFEREVAGVRCMAVGEFTEDDLGIKCYHSKVGAVELLLNHLIDKESEYVLVDMTAGADSFASGIFTKFDLTLLVVEPTLKSIGVYSQYQKYAKEYGVHIKVVANKVEDESDVTFLQNHLGDDLLAVVRRSSFVRSGEKGTMLTLDALEPENREALAAILAEINRSEKNWKKLYEQAVHFHIKNAESWANISLGEDLILQVDPEFSFEPFVR